MAAKGLVKFAEITALLLLYYCFTTCSGWRMAAKALSALRLRLFTPCSKYGSKYTVVNIANALTYDQI